MFGQISSISSIDYDYHSGEEKDIPKHKASMYIMQNTQTKFAFLEAWLKGTINSEESLFAFFPTQFGNICQTRKMIKEP